MSVPVYRRLTGSANQINVTSVYRHTVCNCERASAKGDAPIRAITCLWQMRTFWWQWLKAPKGLSTKTYPKKIRTDGMSGAVRQSESRKPHRKTVPECVVFFSTSHPSYVALSLAIGPRLSLPTRVSQTFAWTLRPAQRSASPPASDIQRRGGGGGGGGLARLGGGTPAGFRFGGGHAGRARPLPGGEGPGPVLAHFAANRPRPSRRRPAAPILGRSAAAAAVPRPGRSGALNVGPPRALGTIGGARRGTAAPGRRRRMAWPGGER